MNLDFFRSPGMQFISSSCFVLIVSNEIAYNRIVRCLTAVVMSSEHFSICLTMALLTRLQIMDYGSLPHFCRKEGSGSSKHRGNGNSDDCFSLDHAYHQQLYNYIKQQALLMKPTALIKQGSVHVDVPEPGPEGAKIAKTIENEFHRFENQNGLANSLNGLNVITE